MQNVRLITLAITFLFFLSCTTLNKPGVIVSDSFITENFNHAVESLNLLVDDANKKFQTNNGAFPRTIDSTGSLITTSMYDWTSGFFPGSLWYAYEYSNANNLKAEAIKWTEKLKPIQDFTGNHDLGFMVYCSYGNAFRLTGDESYKSIIIQAAKSLSSRFNEVTGCIKSWNVFKSWHDRTPYYFPVIIDNMMNLEMLFFASKVSGDDSFRHIAIKHAETTLRHQLRADFSTYHVVCYDSLSGHVIAKETAQGYADNSTWARGQAWAIYGFTMVYRETRDVRFLKIAQGLADYFLNNLPTDGIPYWDFNANSIGFTPGKFSFANNVTTLYRDASAASITASGLLELSTFVDQTSSKKYRDVAKKMLTALGSDKYRANDKSNGNFILKHCIGSIPHKNEIDVPLVYADYYFLEALLRCDRIAKGKSLIH